MPSGEVSQVYEPAGMPQYGTYESGVGTCPPGRVVDDHRAGNPAIAVNGLRAVVST